MSIKASLENSMVQETLEAAQVGYMSASLTQIVTPGVGGRLDATHQALNMGDQKLDLCSRH